MGFLKSDLLRNLAIGFVAGALILLVQSGPEILHGVIPEAMAQATR